MVAIAFDVWLWRKPPWLATSGKETCMRMVPDSCQRERAYN